MPSICSRQYCGALFYFHNNESIQNTRNSALWVFLGNIEADAGTDKRVPLAVHIFWKRYGAFHFFPMNSFKGKSSTKATAVQLVGTPGSFLPESETVPPEPWKSSLFLDSSLH